MISGLDNRIQQEITGVILVGRIYSLSANSPEILGIMEYDLPEAERQLSLWQSRHQDDCDIVRKNPLTLNIRPTFFPDPEQKIQREKYIQRHRVKYGNHNRNNKNRRFRH
jgi:hypothetical protein